MKPLRVTLHLTGHCIETAAKMEMRRLTDLYFNTNNDPDALLKKIELLQEFIKKSDFQKLRSGDERFSGAKEATICLSIGSNNNFTLDFVGKHED